MYSKLILLFATAVVASPGHFTLDIRREYTSASSLRQRELGEPLELAIGGTVSGQSPSLSQTTNQRRCSPMIVPEPFPAPAETWQTKMQNPADFSLGLLDRHLNWHATSTLLSTAGHRQ
jgi:hypothetical protein